MKNLTRILIILVVIKSIMSETWEDTEIICPYQCVCQSSHLMDLSVARWINKSERSRIVENANENNNQESEINNNESLYTEDDSVTSNPVIKFVMCILQSEGDPKDLLTIIPSDVQALSILHYGIGKNISILTSDFNILTDLITLEIRGSKDRSLQLIINEPLKLIQNVNFESITLSGSETLIRPNNPIHPSESFDYVPKSERFSYNVSVEIEEEIEILPYEVYVVEIQKSRMVSFYGWENLIRLRIHNCKLDQLNWEMFDGLNNLEDLSLEHNEIKIIPPFAFYGAMHIKTLSLAHNYILDINYRSLAGLLDLKTLDLSYNNISKLSELTFPPFPKLQIVDFRFNPVKYIFPSTFGIMNNTKIMFLGSDIISLELTTKKPFESLILLNYLSISNVTIAIIDQNTFKGLKNLKILKLKGNISRIDFDAFTELPKLRELDLSYTQLKEISMDAFLGCKNLEIINLSNNNLTYIPPGLFDDQQKLIEIYLNNNFLRFLPSNFFTKPLLKLVQLNDNPWKCSCDMITWKPFLTYQIRGLKQKQCIRDFHSGKTISCRILDVYKTDKKLTPRCANIKNRSVYYALRKNLQCDFNKKLKIKLKYQNWNKNKILKHRSERIVIPNKFSIKNSNNINYLSKINNGINSNETTILGKIDDYEAFNYI